MTAFSDAYSTAVDTGIKNNYKSVPVESLMDLFASEGHESSVFL